MTGAPAVFYLPLQGVALGVEVDSAERHGVCRATVKGVDALGLVHTKGGREERSIVEVFGVEVSACAVELLTHIIRAIHLAAIFQRGNGQLCYLLHGQVQIFPVLTVVGVAVIFHLVGFVIGVAWVVHHHDEGALKLSAHSGIIKLLRGIGLGFAHHLAVFVAESIGKLFHGLAQRYRQHVVDGAQHLCLAVGNGCRLLAVGHHLTQFEAELAQL